MDAFVTLLWLCVAMFVGSFAVGVIPVVVAGSGRRGSAATRCVSVFGTGLLLSVALTVVIPEGVHVIMSLDPVPTYKLPRLIAAGNASWLMGNASAWGPALAGHDNHDHHVHVYESEDKTQGGGRRLAALSSSSPADHQHQHQQEEEEEELVEALVVDDIEAAHHGHGEHESHGGVPEMRCVQQNPYTEYIGAALAAGFVFQLLVDRISHSQGGHGHSHGGGGGGSHADDSSEKKKVDTSGEASASGGVAVVQDVEMGELSPRSSHTQQQQHVHGHGHGHGMPPGSASKQRRRRKSHDEVGSGNQGVTTGLLVHAAVDGVAMGAASFSQSGSLEFIVFLAIMLHKGPAAFGLASYFVRAGLSRGGVLRQLFLFSAAAPVMAVVTFLTLATEIMDAESASEWLGLCLLFSAGTFLYVATVHVLPDLQRTSEHGLLSWMDVAVLVGGIVMPLFIGVSHDHAHGGGGGGGGHGHSHG